MTVRRVLQGGSLVWAAVGAVIALGSLGQVNVDARYLVGLASIAGPLCAVAASRLLAAGADRWAGGLLVLSVLTPTYFAFVVNLPALVVGLALLVAPRRVLPARAEPAEVHVPA